MTPIDGKPASFKQERDTDDDLAEEMDSARVGTIKDEAPSTTSNSPAPVQSSYKVSRSPSASASQSKSATSSTPLKDEFETKNGRISPKQETSKPAKPNRAASQKIPPRIAPLFNDLPDATEEANSLYTVIDSCTYQNKYLGYTEHAMECDCTEEWGMLLNLLYMISIVCEY